MSIKAKNAIKKAFVTLTRKAVKGNITDEFKTTAIESPEVWARYMKELGDYSEFFSDMIIVQEAGLLRNVNVRELTPDQYDPKTGMLTVSEAKNQRSSITKHANATMRKAWLKKLKAY
ncbi:hypothetical protein BCS96_06590 [Vibrio breoganii]|uniref:hypothetical protein n=1 Tax=Vibrio breoganii TaxID=553239 RepID=UPI000C81EBC4|nr:hypothetical protein [Vibrio breoganii]PMG35302.1 hypothetical protein BCU93_17635 [Vibrio breoganii]PMG90787.1 hypothetical protein BCU81_05355 [Vibrio breoganii]PML80804.1 hypothetical protein BCT68_14755 [Vibrio breoganii]PMP00609.1 hypothetical protein BCS96_06590 [Vibrio breoganii]